VPSRIKAIIEGTGADHRPTKGEMMRHLQASRADFPAIACNTAHSYYDTVQDAVDIPVINLIEQVALFLQEKFNHEIPIGILASPAVAITDLYTKVFERCGLINVWPNPENQELLPEVIKAVKKVETGAKAQQGLSEEK